MSHQSHASRGKAQTKSKPTGTTVPAAAVANALSSAHPNGRSAAQVAAAAAEARRQHSHTAADDDDESRGDADVEYVAADPLDDDVPPPSGVLTFMRRSRSDSAAAEATLFRMDSDEVAAAASASAASHHPAHPPHRIPRRGSVEAEMQLPLPDEDDLLEGTLPVEIGRADSPEVEDDEKEGEKGVELESALINRAAAAAAAASVPASAYRSAIAARPPGGLSVGDFELLSVVGRGAYGKVFLVRAHASGRLYAMKVVMKSEAIRKNVVANMLAEKNVLEAVRHPFIVNLRFAFQTESKLYLVLDYIGGGELFARLDASKDHSLSIKEARFYAAEIVLAIEHLHSLNIVYRDLKPENCLLTRDGHICLTDFGFAKEAIAEADSGTKSFCGTLHYMSPEMIQYSGHGKGSDWWALGALLHEMLTGCTPFSGNNRATIQQNILTAPLRLPKWMDNPTKSILTELLRRPISKRLGCGPTGAAAIKSHAFFAGINWSLLSQKKVPAPFVPPMSEAGEACTRNFDARFTAERAVDTPVSPSQMAHVLAGHGISPGAFLTADATFANFAYKRDHTPAASPMLRGLDPSLMRRQGSTGNAGGAGVPIGSPRPLSGLPPPHHSVHHHSSQQHSHPESLELTPAASAKASSAATVAASAAALPATAESVDSIAWPTVDPAVLKQREQQAAAKAAARKAAAAQQGHAATPASPPPAATVPSAASVSVASPPRVKRPQPVKANASPPAPVDTAAAAASVASPISPATASASPSSARSGPSGGASSQLSKQLAARQQTNQQAQQQAPSASVAVRPPPGRGWESKSTAAAPVAAAPAPTLPKSSPPPPPAAVAPAPVPAASVAPPGALGIRVLGGIKSLAPVPAAAAPAAAVALLPSPAPASAAPSAAAAVAGPASSTPLRLSAAAKVFVPGAWGAPKPPVAAAAPTVPVSVVAPAAAAAASAATAATALTAAAVAAPAKPIATAASPTPAPAAAAASNPLGAARWGAKTSAPAPIPQKKAS